MLSIQKISDGLNRRVECCIAVMGMSMTLIVAAQVVFRYLLNNSLFWSEELARYLLVWLTFLGASVAYYRGVHPGVDVCFSKLSPGGRRWVMVGVHMVSLAFFAMMVVQGSAFAWFVRLQISPALSLPKWIVMSIVPLAGAVFLVHGLGFLMAVLRR